MCFGGVAGAITATVMVFALWRFYLQRSLWCIGLTIAAIFSTSYYVARFASSGWSFTVFILMLLLSLFLAKTFFPVILVRMGRAEVCPRCTHKLAGAHQCYECGLSLPTDAQPRDYPLLVRTGARTSLKDALFSLLILSCASIAFSFIIPPLPPFRIGEPIWNMTIEERLLHNEMSITWHAQNELMETGDLDQIAKLLQHPSAKIRGSVAFACNWPSAPAGARSLVAEAYETETDSWVRRQMKNTLGISY
jgi:hypothetical protein